MNHRGSLGCALLAASSVLSAPPTARGQAAADQAVVRNVREMTFVPFPGMPVRAPGSVQSGDPTKGPSIIVAKLAAGCTIPWHWHTPNEHLMMVNGVARMEMKDGEPMTLRTGAFALMPSHHVHQFRCISACTLYIYSDGAFDIRSSLING